MEERAKGVYALIIAGGRGTRFWPRSRRALPKQCIALGSERTLIQATVDRILPAIGAEQILVVTSASMADVLREQLTMLPPENILVEPMGRNTAPAVGWGAMEIARRAQGGNPVMVVLPSDHLIVHEDELRDLLLDCAEAARATNALVTIGLSPTRPETGYGYLEVGGELGNWGDRPFLRVERFVEKPDRATAEVYLEGRQHLWNAGMFVFTVDAIRDSYRQHLPETWALLEMLRHTPGRLEEIYPQLEATSIDYGIMERSKHVLTVRADLGWSDVGSWDALAEHLTAVDGGVAQAAGTVGIDASGNVIHAPGKLVALVGVSDLIVVDTPDALLVVPRDQAQRVREIIAELERRGADEYL